MTSDSDFAYLCRKLRERGAMVYIVGETKAPAALRNASDQFFEWTPEATDLHIVGGASHREEGLRPESPQPALKRRPKLLVDAVDLLVASASEGKVALGALGAYLKRMDPAFSPQTYGHSGLLNMVKTYDLLAVQQEAGGHWSVMRSPTGDVPRTSAGAAP